MTNRFSNRCLLAGASLVLASVVSGCATEHAPFRPIDEVYDSIHHKGARDAVDLLREGMKERSVYGVTDPYTPLRVPEEVVPVWVPPYADKRTGRRVDGHWEHSVIRSSQWYTD